MPEINVKLIRFEEYCEGNQEIRIELKHKKQISLWPLSLNFDLPTTDEDYAKSLVSIVSKDNRNIDIFCNGEEVATDLMTPFCFLDGVFQISSEGEVFIESAIVVDGNEEEIPESLRVSNSQQFFGSGQMVTIHPIQNRVIVSIRLEERAKSELSLEFFETGKEFASASIMLQHDFDHEEKCYFNIWRDVFNQEGKYIESLRQKVGYCQYYEDEPYTVSLNFRISTDTETPSFVDCFFQVGETILTKKGVELPIRSISHVRIRQSHYREVPGNYTVGNLLKQPEQEPTVCSETEQ